MTGTLGRILRTAPYAARTSSLLRLAVVAALVCGSAVAGATSEKADRQQLQQQRMNQKRFSEFGFSSATDMNSYFTISEVKTVRGADLLSRGQVSTMLETAVPKPPGVVDQIAGTITGILMDPGNLQNYVVLGQKLWQIVVANQAVLNASTQRIHVLPATQQEWVQMSNWQGPAMETYTISAKNLYGVTVVSQTYTIAFNYGGQYQAKGAYLANATVIPTKVDVAWGFKLNSEVEVGQVLNTGAIDNPTPGVDLQLKWKMDSLFKKSEGRETFFVKGSGDIVRVSGQASVTR